MRTLLIRVGGPLPPEPREAKSLLARWWFGDDPVEFAEAFAAAYAGKRWIDKERARLTDTIQGLSGEDEK